MRTRDWNRRHRSRRDKYTKFPEDAAAGISDGNLGTRARKRELKNLGPLDQRNRRIRAAMSEAQQEL